jgi:hypothetical protein
MTRVLLQILIAVGVLSSVSLFAVNSFAENANCSGDCEAPTIGLLDNGEQVVTNGLTIGGQSVDVGQHIQSFPTQAFSTGNTVKVKLLVHENNGISALRHVSVAISDYQDDQHRSDKATVSFEQDFEGMQTTSVTDNGNLLKGTTATLTVLDEFNASVEFSFTIMKPFDTSAVIVESWDADNSSRSNVFLEAIKAYGNPIVEKTSQPAKHVLAPLKQVAAGVAPEDVKCRDGYELVIRSTGAPACVYPFTAETLRNWDMVASS